MRGVGSNLARWAYLEHILEGSLLGLLHWSPPTPGTPLGSSKQAPVLPPGLWEATCKPPSPCKLWEAVAVEKSVIHSEVGGTAQARMEDWAPFTLPRLLPKPFVP